MSNPVVTFTNSIYEPSDPKTVRKTYTMKVFDSISFFLYNEGEDSSNFTPGDMGMEFYLWYRVSGAQGPQGFTQKPNFVTDTSWTSMKAAPSGFITPNKSVMPKLLGPSTLLVDNGLKTPNEVFQADSWDTVTSTWYDGFNWNMDKFNNLSIPSDKWFKFGQVSSTFDSLYVSIKAKDDNLASNKMEMSLKNPANRAPGDWDNTTLVVGGAFTLMLNIVGVNPGKVATSTASGGWKVTIKFGDVTMTIADASTMNVNIAGDGTNGNDTMVNLAEGAAKEGPPQQSFIVDKPPLLINVIPCWNGIIVSTGQQETREVVRSASTFCRKLKNSSIQMAPYSTWFDPTNPADVEVKTDSGAVIVDFGDQMDIVAENCRFEIAYLPKFFVKAMAFDGWLLLSKDTDDITYDYNIYTIYTYNDDSDWVVALPTVTDSGTPGTPNNSSYFYIPWSMATTSMKHKRYAGEIFAYVLEIKETRTTSIKNGNGNFDITWSGGTAGDSGATDWKKYIKNVSVNIGLDGSSGTMTVDKYGVAGQEAIVDQSIGAVVLYVAGGISTKEGTIFEGLGMGTSNSETSGDSVWTVPLVGLEKKLEDIALINPPYMDGETLAYAVDYLCRSAGIIHDMSAADGTIALSASEEINVARFDWKSGTSIKTALDDVMGDTHHVYVVRDGKIFFYQLGTDGLPLSLGPDQSTGYDLTNMVMIDKTPDFDDLRNYVIAMAMQKVPEGQGTEIQQVPTWPMIETRTKSTIPDLPWAKCLVALYSGSLDPAALSQIADNLNIQTSTYELTGRITIPGNANIKPYDRWGSEYVIQSVSHTVDLDSKTWTTDLEFMRKAL